MESTSALNLGNSNFNQVKISMFRCFGSLFAVAYIEPGSLMFNLPIDGFLNPNAAKYIFIVVKSTHKSQNIACFQIYFFHFKQFMWLVTVTIYLVIFLCNNIQDQIKPQHLAASPQRVCISLRLARCVLCINLIGCQLPGL